MPDESNDVNQEEMATNFTNDFGDYYKDYEFDESGLEVESDTSGDEQQTSTPDGEKDDGEKSGDDDKSKSDKGDSSDKFEIPKGYGGHFYETGEDGNVTFNTNEALKTFYPKEGQGFHAPEIQFAEKPAEGDKPKSWYETEKERRSNVRDNLFLGMRYYESLRDKGYDRPTAIRMTSEKLDGIVAQDSEDATLRYHSSLEENSQKREKERAENESMQQNAATNRSFHINKLGGGEKGTSNYYGLIQEIVPYVQMMYNMVNGDKANTLTKAEYNKDIGNFIKKLESNANSLNMLMQMANERSLMRHFPNIVERGALGRARNKVGGPSGLNPTGKGQGGKPPVESDHNLNAINVLDAV